MLSLSTFHEKKFFQFGSDYAHGTEVTMLTGPSEHTIRFNLYES